MKRTALALTFILALLVSTMVGVHFGTAQSGIPSLSIEWQHTYPEATAVDGWPYIVIQTSDGGYAIAGRMAASGSGNFAFWLIKTDAEGKMQWNRTYGGSSYSKDSKALDLIQTSDGGYAIIGDSYAFNGWYTAWLVKTDAQGNMQWNKGYPEFGYSTAFSIIQTNDGGYIWTGTINSHFGIVRADSSGNTLWNKTYGGSGVDVATDIIKTSDSGYAVFGSTRSFAVQSADFWLIKIDSNGDAQWNKTYNGRGWDDTRKVVQTSDGGYALFGHTATNDLGPNVDFWLVKTDGTGSALWNKTYGGTGDEWGGFSLVQTNDGGYAFVGRTNSFGAGGNDFWFVKTDGNGNMQLNETYGGSGDDVGTSMVQTSDGGYALVGYTNSFSDDGSYQVWLIKLALATPSPTPTPTLTVSCQSSTTYSNFKVDISGSLTTDGTGISSVPVLLSYSVNGGTSWNDLTLVNTDNNGNFIAVWMPSVTGNYLLKAVWTGNSNYSGVSTIINFAVTPFEGQSVFSVTSNSTLSELSFDSADRELSFSVTGPSGTTGYVDVYIPKSLVSDVSGLKVYLDGNQLAYSAESQADSWLVSFTYNHSTHEVVINLGSASSTSFIQSQLGELIIVGVTITAIAIVAVALVLRKSKKGKS